MPCHARTTIKETVSDQTPQNNKQHHTDIKLTMSNPRDGPLNNNSTGRSISDALDRALGTTYDNPRDSKIRATTHATWHGIQCITTGNQRECERAKDQWSTGFGGSTDHLEKYDAQKKSQ